jgi:hypothetical protein
MIKINNKINKIINKINYNNLWNYNIMILLN